MDACYQYRLKLEKRRRIIAMLAGIYSLSSVKTMRSCDCFVQYVLYCPLVAKSVMDEMHLHSFQLGNWFAKSFRFPSLIFLFYFFSMFQNDKNKCAVMVKLSRSGNPILCTLINALLIYSKADCFVSSLPASGQLLNTKKKPTTKKTWPPRCKKCSQRQPKNKTRRKGWALLLIFATLPVLTVCYIWCFPPAGYGGGIISNEWQLATLTCSAYAADWTFFSRP